MPRMSIKFCLANAEHVTGMHLLAFCGHSYFFLIVGFDQFSASLALVKTVY